MESTDSLVIVHSRSGSINTRSASAPGSIRPLRDRPNRRAGAAATASTSRASEMRPRWWASISNGNWYWMPGVPVWAAHMSRYPTSFSSRVWGAWSEASMSIEPSASASHTAC